MKQPRISELKNNIPLEQLLIDLSKQTTHQAPDKSTFTTFMRSNYGIMFVDEVKRIFKRFESGTFSAEVSDAYNFNEWVARVIAGHRKNSIAHQEQVYKVDSDFYPELYERMKDDSIRSGSMQFRPDIAVYGYEMLKQQCEIPDVEIEKTTEFRKLEGKFLKERRDNGAITYDIHHPLNMAAYRRHVKIHLFEKWFKKNYNL